jgi:hypothetical protein
MKQGSWAGTEPFWMAQGQVAACPGSGLLNPTLQAKLIVSAAPKQLKGKKLCARSQGNAPGQQKYTQRFAHPPSPGHVFLNSHQRS